jgi:hypothetical protein
VCLFDLIDCDIELFSECLAGSMRDGCFFYGLCNIQGHDNKYKRSFIGEIDGFYAISLSVYHLCFSEDFLCFGGLKLQF